MLSTVAGDQLPVMALLEVPDKTGAGSPAQNAAIGVKVGVAGGPTSTVNVVVVAQTPALGVNV